jgi:hypothetical protein
MQDSWSTVLYMCKTSTNLLGTAGAWWLVAACVPGSFSCWCSLTGVMLAADGEAGCKCCDCCEVVVPEFGRSQCYVVCERGRERGRCGVQGKAVKEWRWLWWLYGWMDGGSCGHQLVGYHGRLPCPLPSPQVSLLAAQYAWTPVASSCVISGSLFTSQNFNQTLCQHIRPLKSLEFILVSAQFQKEKKKLVEKDAEGTMYN